MKTNFQLILWDISGMSNPNVASPTPDGMGLDDVMSKLTAVIQVGPSPAVGYKLVGLKRSLARKRERMSRAHPPAFSSLLRITC